MPRPLVSVVIPSLNPRPFLLEALASVAAQTYRPIETILINDGSDDPASFEILRQASRQVDQYLEQTNRGPSAARNAGFRLAKGQYLLPLDHDDRMAPAMIAACVATLERHPEAAFVYPDYEIFGSENRLCRVPDYNLWQLLHRNTVCGFSLMRRAAWEAAGGYDDTNCGYEDWDLWLRFAGSGHYGFHLARPLFYHRKHPGSLSLQAVRRHDELVAKIRARNASLYTPAALARIRKQWGMQVAVLSSEPGAGESHSLEDVEVLPLIPSRRVLAASRAPAFLVPSSGGLLARHSAEQCALAVWSGRHLLRFGDGSIGLSREALGRVRVGGYLSAELQLELAESGWRRDPEPAGVPLLNLEYSPRRLPGRRYAALLVPHLGAPGAALAAGRALGASSEVFVIATDALEAGRNAWETVSASAFDLVALSPASWRAFALHALVAAWRFDTIVLAGSRLGYSVLPDLRRAVPSATIVELAETAEPVWTAQQAAVSFQARPDLRLLLGASALAPQEWEAAFRAVPVPGGVKTLLPGNDSTREVLAGPDLFCRRQGDARPPGLPPTALRFTGGLDLTGLRLYEDRGLATVEFHWFCWEKIARPLRCLTQFVDSSGALLAAADHQILRNSPALHDWEPGDSGYEVRQMILPPGRAAGLQLYLSMLDEETGLRLPLLSSAAPLRDHYTAAIFGPDRSTGTSLSFACDPAPRIRCELEFEAATLTGWSWRFQNGVGWLRLWWRATQPTRRELSFFGHAVGEASSDAAIRASFDHELRLERLRTHPQELVYDVVRDVARSVPPLWLRAGVFDRDSPAERLRIRRSTIPISPQERAVYLPLTPA